MTAKNLLSELLRLEKEGVDLDNDAYFKAPNLSPYDDIDIDFVTGSEETGVVLHSRSLISIDEHYEED